MAKSIIQKEKDRCYTVRGLQERDTGCGWIHPSRCAEVRGDNGRKTAVLIGGYECLK